MLHRRSLLRLSSCQRNRHGMTLGVGFWRSLSPIQYPQQITPALPHNMHRLTMGIATGIVQAPVYTPNSAGVPPYWRMHLCQMTTLYVGMLPNNDCN